VYLPQYSVHHSVDRFASCHTLEACSSSLHWCWLVSLTLPCSAEVMGSTNVTGSAEVLHLAKVTFTCFITRQFSQIHSNICMAKVIWVVCCTWSMLHSNLSYTTAQCSNILVKITQIVHSPNPTFIPQTLLAVSVYIQLGF